MADSAHYLLKESGHATLLQFVVPFFQSLPSQAVQSEQLLGHQIRYTNMLRAKLSQACGIHSVQEMMDATIASGAYEGGVEFTGSEGSNKGKRLNASNTRDALQWAPQYSSFQAFMASGAKDWYSEEALS